MMRLALNGYPSAKWNITKENLFQSFLKPMTGFGSKNPCFIPPSPVIHSLTTGGRFPLALPQRGEGGAKRRVRGSDILVAKKLADAAGSGA